MEDITKEYLVLWNAITDAESALMVINKQLILAQQKAEELYISKDD